MYHLFLPNGIMLHLKSSQTLMFTGNFTKGILSLYVK